MSKDDDELKAVIENRLNEIIDEISSLPEYKQSSIDFGRRNVEICTVDDHSQSDYPYPFLPRKKVRIFCDIDNRDDARNRLQNRLIQGAWEANVATFFMGLA